MGFDVSTGAAYAVLYSILISFTLMAGVCAGWFHGYLPAAVENLFVLSTNNDGSPDYFLSARNSAGATTIALSFFASGMGAWVLYGTTEMGATPDLSWLGVLGYSGASAFPAILICWLVRFLLFSSSNCLAVYVVVVVEEDQRTKSTVPTHRDRLAKFLSELFGNRVQPCGKWVRKMPFLLRTLA
jgi:hypothetical protein